MIFQKNIDTSIFSNYKQVVFFTHICNAEIRNTKANQSSSKPTTVKNDYWSCQNFREHQKLTATHLFSKHDYFRTAVNKVHRCVTDVHWTSATNLFSKYDFRTAVNNVHIGVWVWLMFAEHLPQTYFQNMISELL